MPATNRMREGPVVMIGILKDRRDLGLVVRNGWYRVPVVACPVRRFDYLAFYQPAAFGPEGKMIARYARVRGVVTAKRRDIVPGEKRHRRARDDYYLFRVGRVQRLARPVRNTSPRRVSFAFTTLRSLKRARDIVDLFRVPPIEAMVGRALKRAGIPASAERTVTGKGFGRYRLDFAVFCRNGRIDVECDGEKWHSGPARRRKDRIRDRHLAAAGWTVLRLGEREIVRSPGSCARKIALLAGRLGGVLRVR